MMAGNPNWWSMENGMHNTKPEFAAYSSSSALSSSFSDPSPAADHQYLQPNGQDFPIRSWSQLLLGGSAIINNNNNEENWEGQFSSSLKQEENCQLIYGQYNLDDHDDDCNEFIRPNKLVSDSFSWRHHHRGPVSSPTSCITTHSNNILSFSVGKPQNQKHNQEYHSSECNSAGTGGASKKARVTPQPALKVRKEKLGDRITTLHNLVSPFGKTDTASVLSEANGYIRFLHAQIEALSSPYMRNASAESATHNQHSESQRRSGAKDLRSKGLCLVPTSCTQPIENEMEADYWAPTAFNFSWRHEV